MTESHHLGLFLIRLLTPNQVEVSRKVVTNSICISYQSENKHDVPKQKELALLSFRESHLGLLLGYVLSPQCMKRAVESLEDERRWSAERHPANTLRTYSEKTDSTADLNYPLYAFPHYSWTNSRSRWNIRYWKIHKEQKGFNIRPRYIFNKMRTCPRLL